MSFAIGQRWISHADSELGLGIVVEQEGRRVTLHFPAVEEDRTYATDTAPLTRLRLREGDALHTRDGRSLIVAAVHEMDDMLFYEALVDGEPHHVAELDLDDRIDLATPGQRLLAGQVDGHPAFSLRLATCQHLDRLDSSGLRGLLGTRTALLPHQLYVASEVGRRHAPRVLLADEVGLGKTIEAGMILHRQILAGDTRRAIIMVPESLQFQWLVEMRRRFNLAFALFDEERLAASDDVNPFDEEQLVLCSNHLFKDELTRAQALAVNWDMVIVDEAHRMTGGDDGDLADFLSQLASACPGVLLLTATPEQVGQEAHFERLRILDASRFHDYESFRAEETEYRRWSDLVEALDRGETPDGLPEDIDKDALPEAQIRALIDRYGTGRVLFRNTRAAVGGFPVRDFLPYPLEAPAGALWRLLHPDEAMGEEQWLAEDPRVSWLVDKLKALRPAKVLVICSRAETALALESHLQLRSGIRSAAFHEHLTLLERDRAAAYFAEQEQGAQALICSEIGGEGRNFQFAQHLILFDLPDHPDQLEQRIGRLDRIGQRDRIYLHVPVLENSAQETLMRWYHEGMDLFCRSCSAGDMILRRFRDNLDTQLAKRDAGFEALLQETATFTERTRQELSEGRDRLLERSSCDPDVGSQLATSISELEDPDTLANYLEQLCAVSGVDHEDHGTDSFVIRPGEQEVLAIFPELEEDGQTVTVSRDRALTREDWMFLGWEHPWLEGAMETVLGSSLGQSCVGTLTLRGVPAGSRLYEMVFTTDLKAPRYLGLGRYLSLAPLRLLVDGKGRDLSEILNHEKLNERIEKVPRGTAAKIVKQLQDEIETRIDGAQEFADKRLASALETAKERYGSELGHELARMDALRQHNPAIRSDEIETLSLRRAEGLSALSTARATLQAIRLVVTR